MAYSQTDSFWAIHASGKEADIDVFGVIGDPGLWEEGVQATEFIRELRGLGRLNRLNIHIHSEGGSVWDANAMYQAIRDFQAERVVHVNAMAFSAASYLMLAGDRTEVGPEAQVMIHNPWGLAVGEEKDMRSAADRLVKAKSSILNIYERRTGQKRDILSDMMDAETWLTGGEEIKAAGFADVIKKDQPKVRVAAGPLRLVNHWKNAPDTVIKRKPQPLPPELEARARKLGVIA
jgi:ATP-dependent protease ClpP protease subunit